MPTTTFNNLPEEKKELILAAARKEFARVSINDASINKIIQDANISRGSFYMYFKGKKDLLYYILSEYLTQLIDGTEQAFKNSQGDIFAVFIDIYDFTISYSTERKQEMAILANLFAGMHSGVIRSDEDVNIQELFKLRGKAPDPEEIWNLMDVRNMNINSKDDWEDLLTILFSITRDSITQALFKMPEISSTSNMFHPISGDTNAHSFKSFPPTRERFINMINIIKYGIIKRDSTLEMKDLQTNV